MYCACHVESCKVCLLPGHKEADACIQYAQTLLCRKDGASSFKQRALQHRLSSPCNNKYFCCFADGGVRHQGFRTLKQSKLALGAPIECVASHVQVTFLIAQEIATLLSTEENSV